MDYFGYNIIRMLPEIVSYAILVNKDRKPSASSNDEAQISVDVIVKTFYQKILDKGGNAILDFENLEYCRKASHENCQIM